MSTTDIRNTLRPLSFQANFTNNPDGSCLVKMGNTWVLATANIEEKIPPFMERKGRGWVTAEYSMLPGSTHTRGNRDGRRGQISGRTMEIQRLIGRSLRACVQPDLLGERTVTVDCDVLQADGGTRTASINAGYVALSIAVNKLVDKGVLKSSPIKGQVAALSIGLKEGQIFADLDYELDSTCDVDLNVVLKSDGQIIEIQGTAENGTFSTDEMLSMVNLAQDECQKIFLQQKAAITGA